jgi:hypothetical protein
MLHLNLFSKQVKKSACALNAYMRKFSPDLIDSDNSNHFIDTNYNQSLLLALLHSTVPYSK